MGEVIDKSAAIQIVIDHYCKGCACDAEYCLDAIRELPAVPDIDRAAIMRLCNDIEDIACHIGNVTMNDIVYAKAQMIFDMAKAIGKELTGDAEY